MRLLEKLAQAPQKRQGFQRRTSTQDERLVTSVATHIEQVLNHRLQPGAFAFSALYEQWHSALADLGQPENREIVRQYLEVMDPRLNALNIRTLTANETFEAQKTLQQKSESSRLPDAVFALETEIENQFMSVAVMQMSNGQLQLAQLS